MSLDHRQPCGSNAGSSVKPLFCVATVARLWERIRNSGDESALTNAATIRICSRDDAQDGDLSGSLLNELVERVSLCEWRSEPVV